MGQAASQLEAPPLADPFDGSAAAGLSSDGHADDLLSELAGAEIDRMLAAADVEPPTVAAPAPPPVAVAPPVPPIPPVVAPPVAEVAAAPVPTPIESAPVASAPTVPAPAPEPVVAAPPVATADLDAVLAEASTDHAVAATSADLNLGDPIARIPFLLRPLEMLSAPLDLFPDTVRDLIGKMAVVTLVNSVAIITYVTVFRHHHG
jgi:hypothetical protein